MRKAVARQPDLQPRHPHGRKLFHPGQVGVGVEVVIARTAALVSAEMLAQGKDGEPPPVARASGWRLATIDTSAVVHASAPPLRPLSETHSRGLSDRWDRNYVHSLDWRWLTHRGDSGPGESWLKPIVDLVKASP